MLQFDLLRHLQHLHQLRMVRRHRALHSINDFVQFWVGASRRLVHRCHLQLTPQLQHVQP